jgi:hypothetical protein
MQVMEPQHLNIPVGNNFVKQTNNGKIMKKTFYIILTFVIVGFLVACEPIEKRDAIGAVATQDQISITAVNTTTVNGKKGNQIAVKNLKPEFSGRWNLLVKNSFLLQDTVVIPFKGNVTLYFTAISDGGLVTKSVVVAIDTFDHYVDPNYSVIAGTSAEGKTWVWATDNNYTADHKIWGNGGAGAQQFPGWWGRSPVDADQDNIDLNGQMVFSLAGMSFTKTEFGVSKSGTFSFDMKEHKYKASIGSMSFVGTTILHGISQNNGKKVVNLFDIIKLTEDEMVLMYPTDPDTYDNDWHEGWFWMFKRQGYSY